MSYLKELFKNAFKLHYVNDPPKIKFTTSCCRAPMLYTYADLPKPYCSKCLSCFDEDFEKPNKTYKKNNSGIIFHSVCCGAPIRWRGSDGFCTLCEMRRVIRARRYEREEAKYTFSGTPEIKHADVITPKAELNVEAECTHPTYVYTQGGQVNDKQFTDPEFICLKCHQIVQDKDDEEEDVLFKVNLPLENTAMEKC